MGECCSVNGHRSVPAMLKCQSCRVASVPRASFWWEGWSSPEAWAAMQASRLPRAALLEAIERPDATFELLWMTLAQHGDDPHLVRAVASHPSCPDELLERLADHRSDGVRYEVAQHPSATPFALRYLAGDEDYNVRFEVATHPRTEDWVRVWILRWTMRSEEYADRYLLGPLLGVLPPALADSVVSHRIGGEWDEFSVHVDSGPSGVLAITKDRLGLSRRWTSLEDVDEACRSSDRRTASHSWVAADWLGQRMLVRSREDCECRTSRGLFKKMHPTESEARRVASEMADEKGRDFFAYKCGMGRSWHVSSRRL